MNVGRPLLFALPVTLVLGSSLHAQSSNEVDNSQFLLGIEQGYSLNRGRSRLPLIAPLRWIDSVCLERTSGSEVEIVASFFDLSAFLTSRNIRLDVVESAGDCSPDTRLAIVFAHSFEEAKSKMSFLNEHFSTSHQLEGADQEDFVGIVSIDTVSARALAVVNWDKNAPNKWNSAILLQEIFQAYLGGNDIPWQAEYFSLLHEVDPYPYLDGPKQYSRAWKEEKFEVNPVGLCPVDVFALSAISQYVASLNAGPSLDAPTSRGLINFSWDQMDNLRRSVDKVRFKFADFRLVLDAKCW